MAAALKCQLSTSTTTSSGSTPADKPRLEHITNPQVLSNCRAAHGTSAEAGGPLKQINPHVGAPQHPLLLCCSASLRTAIQTTSVRLSSCSPSMQLASSVSHPAPANPTNRSSTSGRPPTKIFAELSDALCQNLVRVRVLVPKVQLVYGVPAATHHSCPHP